MTVTRAILANPVKDVGGTIARAGTTTRTDFVTIGPSVLNLRHVFTDVVQISNNTIKSLSAGDFGNIHTGTYLIRGANSSVAGAANTALSAPTTPNKHSNEFNYGKGSQRRHITDISFLTGLETNGGNEGDAFTYIASADGGAIDNEAYPTRNVPGEFVYTIGGTPVQADYPSN